MPSKLDEIDDEYCDVTDDEINEIISNYPELLDASNDLRDRYTSIKFNGNIMNKTCSKEVSRC